MGDAPSSSSALWIPGSPPSRSGMPCARSARCLVGASPPSSGLVPIVDGTHNPSPPPLSASWSGGAPPPGLACLELGSQAAVPGGPPLSLALTARRGRARSVPSSSFSRVVCARGWGGGPPSWSWAPSDGRFWWCVFGGSLACRCCTPLACTARPGVRLPLPPLLWLLVLCVSCRSGGILFSVLSWGPALCACAGGPLLGQVDPLVGRSRAGFLRVPPPCPRCTMWARTAGWGCPLSLPPLFIRSR